MEKKKKDPDVAKPVADARMAEAISAPFKGTTDVSISQIKQAIKTQIPQPVIKYTEVDIINKYLSLIDNSQPKLKAAIGALINCSSRISGVDPRRILQLLREKEIATKHRIEIIQILDEALRIREFKKTGLCNEEFDEKKHMTNNRTYGPDHEWNRKRLDKRDESLKKFDAYLKQNKKK